MNRKIKIIISAVSALFIISIIFSVIILRPSGKRTVEIVQDGEVIYTFDLNTEPDRSIVIESPNGTSNTVTIEKGEIFISSAECPDKTCVNMGKLKSGNLPIVCLPNHLVIRFREEN
ncbi:MAG: NusG domain II-containing protein [Ruminococcus sp.]